MKFKYQKSTKESEKFLIGVEGDSGNFIELYNIITVSSEKEAIKILNLLREVYKRGRHDKMLEIQTALNTI